MSNVYRLPIDDRTWRDFNTHIEQFHPAATRLPTSTPEWRAWLRLAGFSDTRFQSMPLTEGAWRNFLIEQEVI